MRWILGLFIGVVGLSSSVSWDAAATATATDPATASTESAGAERRFRFVYEVELAGLPEHKGPVDVYLPIPNDTGHQHVLDVRVEAPFDGQIGQESAFGNRYWYGRWAEPGKDAVTLELTIEVERRVARLVAPPTSRPLSTQEQALLSPFSSANQRVPVGHEMLQPILAEIRQAVGSTDRSAMARGIYDWIVDNVEYKKQGTGWGNGDTFWACNERYGNCTDFHALFISRPAAGPRPLEPESWTSLQASRWRLPGDLGKWAVHVRYRPVTTAWRLVSPPFTRTSSTDRFHARGLSARRGCCSANPPFHGFMCQAPASITGCRGIPRPSRSAMPAGCRMMAWRNSPLRACSRSTVTSSPIMSSSSAINGKNLTT